jgi:hypothetical protein
MTWCDQLAAAAFQPTGTSSRGLSEARITALTTIDGSSLAAIRGVPPL